MSVFLLIFLLISLSSSLALSSSRSQSSYTPVTVSLSPVLVAGFRPPALPLIVNSPEISMWTFETNTEADLVRHWSSLVSPFFVMCMIDGAVYRVVGSNTGSLSLPALVQRAAQVQPSRTILVYTDASNTVELSLTISNTASYIRDDISSSSSFSHLNLPLAFITFSVASIDGKSHSVKLYYDQTGEIGTANNQEQVQWTKLTQYENVLRMGSAAQELYGLTGDGVKVNWGFSYLSASSTDNDNVVITSTVAGSELSRSSFNSSSPSPSLPPFDNRQPRACDDDYPVMSFIFDFATITPSTPLSASSTHLTFLYDDVGSMQYFGQSLKPYWRLHFQDNVTAMIDYAEAHYDDIVTQCQKFDQQTIQELQTAGGSEYATIASLAFRQTTGGIKITSNPTGDGPWVFMKEISSDGDVSTVDVIFPASPFFLYFNPEILRLMFPPLLMYANNETSIEYNLMWAPHHLGTWPVCNLRPDQQEQMPMEESGNMLMMLAAIAKLQKGDIDYLTPYLPLLSTWADYLLATLPDPENQLCTDDFEGPSPHNVNLAAKGIVGLASYSTLLKYAGQTERAALIDSRVRAFSSSWSVSGVETDPVSGLSHTRLQYDLNQTWSLKYNALFQYILFDNVDADFVLPRATAVDDDVTFLTNSVGNKFNTYGLPLDSRATFTKTDWLSWIAAMSRSASFRSGVFHAIYEMAHTTKDRVPFTDWYDTVTGNKQGFQARPVIGGIYALMTFPQ